MAKPEGLDKDASNAEARGVADRVGISEARDVFRDEDRRQRSRKGGIWGQSGRIVIEPDVAAHGAGAPPKAYELAASRPELG